MCAKKRCPAQYRTLFRFKELKTWTTQGSQVRRLGQQAAIKALVIADRTHWAQDGSQMVAFIGTSTDTDPTRHVEAAIASALEG